MNTEIIAVGTELLLGQVVNTNATFLSEAVATLGMNVYYQSVIGDNETRLTQLLEQAKKRSDLIILCGGLGPTEDDLTKQTVASYLKKTLIQDHEAKQKLESFFVNAKKEMSQNNLRQTLTIEGGIPIQNPNGLAVGCLITVENISYLLLPGPPSELRPMFQQYVAPLLKKLFPPKEQLISRVLRFYGIGESQLVTELETLIEQQTNPTIAPYAKTNEVTLRLTAKAKTTEIANKLLDTLEKQVLAKVGSYFYGYGEENSLVNVVVSKLKKAQKTIAVAESLTAGLFQSTLGDIEGVSEVFKGGFVTYSVETKCSFLGIKPKLINKTGTVSETCAIEMAEKTQQLTATDYALSFTGVAGPNKLENQPVGTVWIGVAQKGKTTIAKRYHFNKNRTAIRQRTVMEGLYLLLQALENKI